MQEWLLFLCRYILIVDAIQFAVEISVIIIVVVREIRKQLMIAIFRRIAIRNINRVGVEVRPSQHVSHA
ncbi:hypothetical protein D3C71_1817790 [compost metagenome]